MQPYEDLVKLRQELPAGPEREALKAALYAFEYGSVGLGKKFLDIDKLWKNHERDKVNSKYDLKTAKLFTWCGKSVSLEELRKIKDYHFMSPEERNFLAEVVAAFDKVLSGNKSDEIKPETQQAATERRMEAAKETLRWGQENYKDSMQFQELQLSYMQWKARGRFVKQGEKATAFTMDASGSKYALFSFGQTDLAEESYKSKSEQTKMCACGAQECSSFGCCLDPNS